MSILVSADPGSCHMGKLKYALELIDLAADAGFDVVKWQLFPPSHPGCKKGNIPVPLDWWPHLEKRAYDKRIAIAASFFDKNTFEFAFNKKLAYMKFAYSMQGEKEWIKSCVTIGKKVIVSSDWHHFKAVPDGAVKLYCHTTNLGTDEPRYVPSYPVIEKLNFAPLFPPFDGFSDHTLGYSETVEAIHNGAQYIEKHIKLDYADITCPDANVALSPQEAERLIHNVRRIQL
jgi:N,N'-diacetyllegionaminate synthase